LNRRGKGWQAQRAISVHSVAGRFIALSEA
jgi:hypothetical protein